MIYTIDFFWRPNQEWKQCVFRYFMASEILDILKRQKIIILGHQKYYNVDLQRMMRQRSSLPEMCTVHVLFTPFVFLFLMDSVSSKSPCSKKKYVELSWLKASTKGCCPNPQSGGCMILAVILCENLWFALLNVDGVFFRPWPKFMVNATRKLEHSMTPNTL